MKKLSLLALFFIVAACSTDSSEENSVLQTNVSEKNAPAIFSTSGSSNLSLLISQLEIGSESQKLLLSSINEILRLKQEGATYEEVHSSMVDFEDKVKASSISAQEKEILLSSLTLVQYDIYATEEADGGGRKDRDWELSVGTFIVTTSSPTQSTSVSAVNSETSQIIK